MDIQRLKEMNLPRGAVIEYDLHPNEDRTREAHLGYFLELVENVPDHARSMSPDIPKTPFVMVADPNLNKNWCPQKIHQIPLEDICNLFYHGKSHYVR